MQANQSNSARAQRLHSGSSSSSSVSDTRSPTKKQKVVIKNIPKSLSELSNPECHKAVVLTNQETFRNAQNELIQVIDKITEKNKYYTNNLISRKDYFIMSQSGAG